MAERSMFQRSSPLRTPIRPVKQRSHKLKKSNDVPPLARQLLRSLDNKRRHSLSGTFSDSIGHTVQKESCPLDQSCMDQFDNSFLLNVDTVLPLTPRKSPHLLRRGSLTNLSKKRNSGTVFTLLAASASGQCSSRKKIGNVRKRMMNTVRKVFGSRGSR